MPRCTSHIYDAYKIPDGSRVELWTEGVGGDFDTVTLIEADDRRWTIAHADLFRPPGDPRPPESFLTAVPQRYVVTFFTNFRSAAETEVALKSRIVIDPGNADERSRTPLNCSVAGAEGDGEDHRILYLKTLQS